MIAWMLVVWPLVIRRYVRHRQLASLGPQGALHARSADRGLPALGWLLLAFGVYALAVGLGSLLVGPDLAAAAEGDRGNPLGQLGGLFGQQGESELMSTLVAGLQTWAGLELIRLTSRFRLAGMVYGVAAAGYALYSTLPELGALTRGSSAVVGNPLGIAVYAAVATSLILPIATIVLVQRTVHDRDAIAATFA
jgi:hypothetical protein